MIFLLHNTPQDAFVEDLSNDQLAALVSEGVPLVDIRRQGEWEETGIVAGSQLLTFFDERNKYDLDLWLEQFDKVDAEKLAEILNLIFRK